MPDRYGDPRDNRDQPATPPDPDHQLNFGPTQAELRTQAIAECQLCDPDGYRHHTVCDHHDHQPAAQRGINQIRQQMGWK